MMKQLVAFGYFLALLVCFVQPNQAATYRLAVCALFQNEAFFIREWVEYHQLIGVDHFYLFDNQSSDESLELLTPYIKSGLVELYHHPFEAKNQSEYLHKLQLPAYRKGLDLAKDEAEWVAFIDVDEFLVPLKETNLIDLLKDYQEYAALCVNWQLFGTSGIDKLAKGEKVLENLLWRAPRNHHSHRIVKLIVQPKLVKKIPNPHWFIYSKGYKAVASDKTEQIEADMGHDLVLDRIQLNHYFCGDKDWFMNNKLPRRAKWGMAIQPDHLEAFLTTFNQEKDERILLLLRFLDF